MVIADATTLGAMALIGRAHLIPRLVGKVKITDETAAEIKEFLQARDPSCALPEDVAEVVAVDVSYATLSTSESETLELGRRIKAKLLLSDDVALRREARKERINTMGTVGLLYAARCRVLIPNVEEPLEALHKAGYTICLRCERALLGRVSVKSKPSEPGTTIFDFRL